MGIKTLKKGNMMKKYWEKTKAGYQQATLSTYKLVMWCVGAMCLLPSCLMAADSDSPFGSIGSVDPANIEKTATGDVSSGLKSGLIIAGCFLLIAGIGVLAKAMTKTAEEKREQGNGLLTLILAVVCVAVGLGMVGIAWKGASATIS